MKNLIIQTYIKSDQEKKGLSPLYCRITYNQTKTSFSLGQKVNTKRWRKDNFRSTRDSEERLIRSDVDKMIIKIENVADMWEQEHKLFTAEMLKNSFLNNEQATKQVTITDCFAAHKKDFFIKIDQKSLKKSAYKKYRSVEAHLELFVKEEYKQTSFIAENLDDVFFNRFNKYLYTKLQHNQVVKYCILFRRVIKQAYEEGMIKLFPFRAKYKVKLKEVVKESLTKEQVHTIENKEFTIERITRVKDVFLFCCYTGLAYADVFALSEEEIFAYQKKNLVIEKQRIKTGIQITSPLVKKAKTILDKYRNNPDCIAKGKLLPVISNSNYNVYLKEIQDCCKIPLNCMSSDQSGLSPSKLM